jgi:excisionase family DNA binding protein
MSTRRTISGTLLGVREAAAYLGGSERWLRRLLEHGLVPHKRIGRNIYFKRSELDGFVDDLPGITPRQARFNAKQRSTDE